LHRLLLICAPLQATNIAGRHIPTNETLETNESIPNKFNERGDLSLQHRYPDQPA